MSSFIPVIITAATTIGVVFLREWWVYRLAEKKNQQTAIWIARIFLLRELEENIRIYNKVIINNARLSDILESDWYEISGKDTPGPIYNQHRMAQYQFQVTEWDKQKSELVKLDFELAKQLANVYRRFELLKRYAEEGVMLSDVHTSIFKGMADEYSSLINKIKEAP